MDNFHLSIFLGAGLYITVRGHWRYSLHAVPPHAPAHPVITSFPVDWGDHTLSNAVILLCACAREKFSPFSPLVGPFCTHSLLHRIGALKYEQPDPAANGSREARIIVGMAHDLKCAYV